MNTWTLIAFNNAVNSENRIHADDIARDYGFKGGLVPGVTVYAYMTHPVVEVLGAPWLERGMADVRFLAPCYDGEEVTAAAIENDEGGFAISLNREGQVLARGNALIPSDESLEFQLESYPFTPLPASRIPAETGELRMAAAAGDLGSLEFDLDESKLTSYLKSVRETHPIYLDRQIAHPGLLLSAVNFQLGANVALGPWIHAGSTVRHFGLAKVGDHVSVRGRILEVYERRGHEFLEMDVVIVTNGEQIVAKVEHTAIYKIRKVD